MSKRRRLIAYDPLTGATLGELPHFKNLHTDRGLYGLPTLTFNYPDDGANRTLINTPVEIGVEKEGPARHFDEYFNCRYLRSGTPDNDDVGEDAVKTYNFIGIGVRLSWALVKTPSPSDEPDGTPVELLRHWTNKTVGAILGDLFTEAQSRGMLLGLTKDHGFAADSSGAPWGVDQTLDYFEINVKATVWDVAAQFEAEGRIEQCFNRREWRVFNTGEDGTLHRDLTVGPDPTGFYWGSQAGITKATIAADDLSSTTDAYVTGPDGKTFTPHNYGSDGHAFYGPIERAIDIGWAHTADLAHAGCDALFRAGARQRQEFTLDIDWDASAVDPDLDFRIGDLVIAQKGENPATAADVPSLRNTGQLRILRIIEDDDEKSHGSVSLGDRLQQREIAALQRVQRITAGADVAQGGLSRIPGPDPREPSAPTSFGITPANEPDEQGRQRANHALTWAWSGDAVPDPVTGQVDPIEIKGFEIEYQSDYTDNDWQLYTRAKATATAARLRNLPADTDYLFRIRAIPYTGITPSAWTTSTTVTIPTDLDALPGPSEIQDAGHRNAGIRVKRAADAGAGFSFVSDTSEYVLSFTSTTPSLDYGVGAKLRSFRRECRPGDLIVVDGEIKRVGGTTAACRVMVRFFDASGATLSTVNAISSATATIGFASMTAGTATAPAGARTFSVRVKANTLTGSGAELRVRNVTAFRQVDTDRVKDLAIIGGTGTGAKVAFRTLVADNSGDNASDGRVIHKTDNLGSLHTSTAALLQAASGTTGWKGGTTGLFFYVSGVAAFSATASGVYVKGVIETGSGMIIGGAGLADIWFAAGYTIGTAGGFLEYVAGGSGHKFTGAMIVSGAITGSSTLQITSTATFLGSTTVNGSGTTLGFYGSGGSTIQNVAVTGRTADQKVDDLISALASGYHLITQS